MKPAISLAAILVAALMVTSARAATTNYPNSTFQLLIASTDAEELITFTGPSAIQDNIGPGGTATDTYGADGLDDAALQITSLSLTGTSTTLGLGVMTMHLLPEPSIGVIEETVNSLPGILEVQPYSGSGSAFSFFDVFFELDFAGGQLKTGVFEQVNSSYLDHWPPGPGDVFENGNDWVIDLVDPNGDPTDYYVLKAYYSPVPEPATVALLALAGFLGCALAVGRSRWGGTKRE
jgi:hypothetical protein